MAVDPNSPEVKTWLAQLAPDDVATAQQLLTHIDFISADEIRNQLIAKLRQRQADGGGSVALYAERHLRGRCGIPFPLYKWKRRKIRRAEGIGPRPVESERLHDHETGSEGILGTLITSISRENGSPFLDHPSMTTLRNSRPNRFILVTDFIGSGSRACRYLEAAWQTPTIASWASYKRVSFEVVAFSGTGDGIKKVEAHSTSPMVSIVKGCPTISGLGTQSRESLIRLCEDYCPKPPSKQHTALGYGNAGALMVFAHGAPNNTPLLLHTKTKKWRPLFEGRSTARWETGVEPDFSAELTAALTELRQQGLAGSAAITGADPITKQTILVLAALRRQPKSARGVSARTGLSVLDVELAIRRCHRAGFIDEDLRLTDAAFKEFAYLRKSRSKPGHSTSPRGETYYYPQMLRSPDRV